MKKLNGQHALCAFEVQDLSPELFNMLVGHFQFLLPGKKVRVFLPSISVYSQHNALDIALFRMTRPVGKLAAGVITVFSLTTAFFLPTWYGFPAISTWPHTLRLPATMRQA